MDKGYGVNYYDFFIKRLEQGSSGAKSQMNITLNQTMSIDQGEKGENSFMNYR